MLILLLAVFTVCWLPIQALTLYSEYEIHKQVAVSLSSIHDLTLDYFAVFFKKIPYPHTKDILIIRASPRNVKYASSK